MALVVVICIAIVCTVLLAVRQHRFNTRPIVILGTGPMTSKLVDEFDWCGDGCRLAGIVDHEKPKAEPLRLVPFLGSFDCLTEIVERERPSRIVVALADRRGRLPLESLLQSRIRGVVVEDALEFYEHLTGKIAIEALTPGALILSKGFEHEGVGQWVARVMSVGIALAGLIVCAPILLLVAIAIKIDSRGPVFFVQERAGWNGMPFQLLKFRTMHPAEERPSEWVQDNVGRITRVGKWLRRFRLADEFGHSVGIG